MIVGRQPFDTSESYLRSTIVVENRAGASVDLQLFHGVDDPLIDGANLLLGVGDIETIGKVDRLAENDDRAAEQVAGQPAPDPRGLGTSLAENPLDPLMIDRDDGDGGFGVGDGKSRAVFDGRQVIAAGTLIEDQQIMPFQEIDVFTHQPGVIATFDRDGPQQRKELLEKPDPKVIFLGGEVDERAGGVDDITGEMRGHPDQKRLIHRLMISHEQDPASLLGNVIPAFYPGEIEREHEKQETDKSGENHGHIGNPDPDPMQHVGEKHDHSFTTQAKPRCLSSAVLYYRRHR